MLRQLGLAVTAVVMLGSALSAVAEDGEPGSGSSFSYSPCTATGDLCTQVSDLYVAAGEVLSANPADGGAGLLAAIVALTPNEEGLYTLERESLETIAAPRLEPGALVSTSTDEPALPMVVIPAGPAEPPRFVGFADATLGQAQAAAPAAPSVAATLPADPRQELQAFILDLGTYSTGLIGMLEPPPEPEPAVAASAPPLAREDVAGFRATLAAPPLAVVGHESLGNEPVALASPSLPTSPAPAPRPTLALLGMSFAAPELSLGRDLLAAAVAAITVILLLPPLYHRLHQHQLLEHEARARLYKIVVDRPGIHIEELARLTECSRSTVVYHLRLLARHGYVVTMGGRKSVHYYPNTGGADPVDRERRALLTSPRARALAARIVAQPGIQRAALAAEEGISVSTLSWHIGRLLRAGLVEDRLAANGRELHPGPGLGELLRPWAAAPAVVVATLAPEHPAGLPPATEAAAPL